MRTHQFLSAPAALAVAIGTSLIFWPMAASAQVPYAPPSGPPGYAVPSGPPQYAVPAASPVSPAEVLARGPVNEAFAEPVTYNPEPSIVVPREPPPAINEVLPAVAPAGENVVWIPGYWAWDQDANNFIWVSGCWRDPPPGHTWVPGYWTPGQGGWQWVAGFWMSDDQQEIEYLPPPPQAVEPNPPADVASSQGIWVPGIWVWSGDRYMWRPGYWLPPQADWVWVPAYYISSPRGYVFVDGYWDYPLDRRGTLFAPVAFESAVYQSPAFTYVPSYVVDTNVLELHLFAWPRYHHYYFGDYYEQSYLQQGIIPWYQFGGASGWYDPLFAHRAWRYGRQDPRRWVDQQRTEYERYRDDRNLRPAHTLAAQEQQASRLPEAQRQAATVVAPLSQVATSTSGNTRYTQVTEAQRQKMADQGKELTRFRQQRAQWEHAQPVGQAPAAEPVKPPVEATTPAPRPTPPATPPQAATPATPAQPAVPPARPAPRPEVTPAPPAPRPEAAPPTPAPRPEVTPPAPRPSAAPPAPRPEVTPAPPPARPEAAPAPHEAAPPAAGLGQAPLHPAAPEARPPSHSERVRVPTPPRMGSGEGHKAAPPRPEEPKAVEHPASKPER